MYWPDNDNILCVISTYNEKRLNYDLVSDNIFCIAKSNFTWWFSPGTLVFSTNKTDGHDMTEILLKVALSTINHQILCIFQTSASLWKYCLLQKKHRSQCIFGQDFKCNFINKHTHMHAYSDRTQNYEVTRDLV
jgi:hypothetical protein